MTVCGDRGYNASLDENGAERFLKAEIEQLVLQMDAVKKENPFTGLNHAKRKKLEETELTKLIQKRNKLLNAAAEIRLLKAAHEADKMTGNPVLGIHAVIGGVNTPLSNNLKSIHANQIGLLHKYVGGMIYDLKQEGLMQKFNSMKGDFEREVARALSVANTPGKSFDGLDPDAVKIAKIMHKYQKASVARENVAGAYIRPRKGYVVSQSHSPRKMEKAGKKAWINFVKDRLDFETMDVPKKDRRQFLEDAYAAIKSGVRITEEADDVTKSFKGPRSMARTESASRRLVFKSADDWYDYDKEFGYGSVREAFVQDLFQAARATSVMDAMGTNPEAMLERVKSTLSKVYRDDKWKVDRINGRTGTVTAKALLDEVTGAANIGASGTIAQVFSAYRAIQTMAKLGGAAIMALIDVPMMASTRMFQGAGFFKAWEDALMSPIRGFSQGEMKKFADLMGAGLEYQLGDFMSRMHAQDEVAGLTAKTLHYFFKLNLLGPWTSANKRGITIAISRDLASNADTPYSQLPTDLRNLLSSYGITSVKWDLAQKAVTKGPDGRTYLLPAELDNLDVNDESLMRREEPGSVLGPFDQRTRERLVMETQESLQMLLSNEADHAVPSPGARERAILRQGYRPGTPEGEAIRFMAQFKSFGVTVLTKATGRQMYGRGKFRDQLKMGLGANMGLINTMVSTTIMAYFVIQAKEMLAGREPKPMSPELLTQAIITGGGAGIYGDFLYNQSVDFSGGIGESVLGPGVTTAFELFDILTTERNDLLSGDENNSATKLVKLARANTPLANLFYTKQVTDYMFWYHLLEASNPGYLRRMERRFEQEGQEWTRKPSDTIARGGFEFR